MFVFESDLEKPSVSLMKLTTRALELQNELTSKAQELNTKIDILADIIPDMVLVEKIVVDISIKEIMENGKVEIKNNVSIGGIGGTAIFAGFGVAAGRLILACVSAAGEGLSGAAIITRALSILGGGPIAVGGGGMAGGLASLGIGFLGVGLAVVGVGVGVKFYRNSVALDEINAAHGTMAGYITELTAQLTKLKEWEENKLLPLYKSTMGNMNKNV